MHIWAVSVFLANINSANMDTHIQVWVEMYFQFSWDQSSSGIAGSYGNSMFNF